MCLSTKVRTQTRCAQTHSKSPTNAACCRLVECAPAPNYSYGTIAEIGAGQEVARTFFKAGGAAGTVAKTLSGVADSSQQCGWCWNGAAGDFRMSPREVILLRCFTNALSAVSAVSDIRGIAGVATGETTQQTCCQSMNMF